MGTEKGSEEAADDSSLCNTTPIPLTCSMLKFFRHQQNSHFSGFVLVFQMGPAHICNLCRHAKQEELTIIV